MYISDIQNLKKLEYLGYNLQCHERTIAIIFESYRKYSMYYILLFKEMESMYFRKDLIDFSAEKANILNSIKYITKNEIKNYIVSNIATNKKMIFISDHFWNSEYSSYYQTKHYKHPMILRAFDGNEVIIIDEDIESISREGNKYYSWPYTEKKMKFKDFERICGQWTNDNSINQYEVLEFSTNDVSDLRLEDIIDEYIWMIKTINENFLENVSKFYQVIKEHIIEKNTNNITDEGMRYLYNHSKAINRQYRFFIFLLQNHKMLYEELYDLGKNIKDLYEMYYLLALKNLRFNDAMWEMTDKIYLVEKRFYEFLFGIVKDKTIRELLGNYANL